MKPIRLAVIGSALAVLGGCVAVPVNPGYYGDPNGYYAPAPAYYGTPYYGTPYYGSSYYGTPYFGPSIGIGIYGGSRGYHRDYRHDYHHEGRRDRDPGYRNDGRGYRGGDGRSLRSPSL